MLTLSLAVIVVAAAFKMLALIRTAPLGYENERGFHFGLDPDLEF
jgi:hypothetical protein